MKEHHLQQLCSASFSKGLAATASTEETAQASFGRATKTNEIDKAAEDQQLCIGGEPVRPTIAATVPTEEGEGAGLGEEAHTAEQVRLV